MMNYVRTVPEWVTDAREELKTKVEELARKHNVDIVAVRDSITIDSSVGAIINKLEFIKDNASD